MTEQCPYGYSDPRKWCEWRNSEIAGSGLRWIVGPSGTPMLTDDHSISERRRIDEARRREDERRRFNWRREHPITESTE